MASSYGQAATPFNPQLIAQMFSDPVQKQNFYMALADVYRANMEAQTKNLAHAAFPNNAAQYQSLPSVPSDAPHVPAHSAKVEEPTNSVSSRPPSAASTPSPSSAKGKRRATSPGPHVSGSSTPVFIHKGASVVFYVQVDLSQRHDIVNKIKVCNVLQRLLVNLTVHDLEKWWGYFNRQRQRRLCYPFHKIQNVSNFIPNLYRFKDTCYQSLFCIRLY